MQDREDGDDVAIVTSPLGLNLLFSPLEAIVDLVFVYGGRGGSRETWSERHRAKDMEQIRGEKNGCYEIRTSNSFGFIALDTTPTKRTAKLAY